MSIQGSIIGYDYNIYSIGLSLLLSYRTLIPRGFISCGYNTGFMLLLRLIRTLNVDPGGYHKLFYLVSVLSMINDQLLKANG